MDTLLMMNYVLEMLQFFQAVVSAVRSCEPNSELLLFNCFTVECGVNGYWNLREYDIYGKNVQGGERGSRRICVLLIGSHREQQTTNQHAYDARWW